MRKKSKQSVCHQCQPQFQPQPQQQNLFDYIGCQLKQSNVQIQQISNENLIITNLVQIQSTLDLAIIKEIVNQINCNLFLCGVLQLVMEEKVKQGEGLQMGKLQQMRQIDPKYEENDQRKLINFRARLTYIMEFSPQTAIDEQSYRQALPLIKQQMLAQYTSITMYFKQKLREQSRRYYR